ncbi:MAG: hypothetical protein KC656_15315, partial [Myxococcales bacterium]|nr:hypothetical protein [Myxococcales bacterium]
SPSATGPDLTTIDGTTSTDQAPGLFWRTAPPDDIQAAAISSDMLNSFDVDDTDPDVYRTAPSLNVGVVHQTNNYGQGLADAFRDAHVAAGGSVTTFAFDTPSTRNDAVIDALNADVDEIVFVSSDIADIVGFLQAAVTNPNAAGLPIFLTDAARNADVLGADIDGSFDIMRQVRGTVPASPDGTEYQGFVGAYASAYDGADVEPLSYTSQSYDAAWLVMYGHAWALGNEESITGTTIARGFRRVSSGPRTLVRASSWSAVKASFAEGTSIDAVGSSSELAYDPVTGELVTPIDVWRITNYGVPGVEAAFQVVTTYE